MRQFFRRLFTTTLLIIPLLFVAGVYMVQSQYRPGKEDFAMDEPTSRALATAALFDALLAHGLLGPIASPSWPDLPPRDFSLDATGPGSEEQHDLVKRLYRTETGARVQTMLLHWKREHRVAAIRDDRDGGKDRASIVARQAPSTPAPAPTPAPTWAGFVVEDGVRPTRWSAQDIVNDEAFPATIRKDLSPRFGYVSGNFGIGFGDWLAVTPHFADGGTIRFTTRLDPQSTFPVTIQVIGDLQAVRIDGIAKPDLLASARGLCDREKQGGCKVGQGAQGATLELAHSNAEQLVELEVQTTTRPIEENVPGNPISHVTKLTADSQNVPVNSIVRATAEMTSYMAWQEKPAETMSEQEKPSWFRIYDRTGTVPLTSEDGRGTPTAEALKHDLLPIVGIGPVDSSSLTAVLARSVPAGEERELRLTIDIDVQRRAAEALKGKLDKLGQNKERRAALVVLDAENGDILAAVGHPQVKKGSRLWDLRALDMVNAADSPLNHRAWGHLDRHNAPGSVFKLVTALTMVEAAAEGDEFARIAVAGMGEDEFQRQFHVNIDAGFINVPKRDKERALPDFPLKNYRGNPTKRALAKPEVTGCAPRPGGNPGTEQIGLCEAIWKSTNTWFAAAALHLDGEKLRTGPSRDAAEVGSVPDKLRFSGMLARLGLTECVDLAAPLRPPGRCALKRGSPPDRSVTKPLSPTLRPGATEPLLQLLLAQHSIGQGGVSIAPLHIAALYASVDTERIIQPRLIAGVGRPGAVQDIKPEQEAPPLFDMPVDLSPIKRGMEAVVRKADGTAEGSFNLPGTRVPYDVRQRAHGKTGTAQIGTPDGRRLENYGTVWFAGGAEIKMNGKDRRLALTCMISHASSDQTGGGTCAPIVAGLLAGLEGSAGAGGRP